MYSIIIPVYRNEGNLPSLLICLEALRRELDLPLEVVFVVDGSPDGSFAYLKENLPRQSFEYQLLLLSRNFGSTLAVRAGMEAAHGQWYGVMAADLQEPPELMIRFFRRLATGECDIVVGRRENRNDPWFSQLASRWFWKIYRRWVQKEIPEGGVDVFACNRVFRDHLLALREANSTLIGLIFWMGFRREEVTYQRLPRLVGKSAWRFSAKIRYMLDTVFAFSGLPIRLLTFSGGIGLFIAVVWGGLILIDRLFIHTTQIPGYSATAILILFFGGLNLFGLGVIGEYLWRTFENTKNRPLFFVLASSRGANAEAGARKGDSLTFYGD